MKDEKLKEKREDKHCEELKKQVEEWENKYRRALADYQNLQKRSSEERIHWIKTANKELLLRLLPVLDTLLIAAKHSGDQTMQVVSGQFLDVLKAEGVERIKTKGEKFDPRTMECIQTEEGEDGKVLKEVRPGYILNDMVLRVAQVVVGKL